MNTRIFREYDIRGVADRDLSDELAEHLGKAIGTTLVRKGLADLTLGRDVRLSSPRLHTNLVQGLLSTGIKILDIGVCATPVLYFGAMHLASGGGVMITGSHNPPEDNGFKIVVGKGSLFGDDIQALLRMIQAKDFVTGKGTTEPRDVFRPYIDACKARIALGPRRLKVVVDAGNGVGGIYGPTLYRELGFDVVELFVEPDGRFPNHHPDPTVEANVAALKAKIAETGAELGIAYDGDADRIGVVDAKGRIVWGDQLMILLGKAILAEVPGATFVSEVKCSQALYDELNQAGGKAIMWKVGHSLIKNKMKEVGAQLAGEMSGHIFFAHRYFGFDDAIYSGARLLELLSKETRTATELVDTLPVMINTPELRVDMPDDIKFAVVKRVTERLRPKGDVVDIDGVRVSFGDGWGLVRASNTQPALVLRFEAKTHDRLLAIRALVETELAAARKDVEGA